MSFLAALAIDCVTVAFCFVALRRFGRLRHSHPSVVYLFFHVYTFTLRLVGLLNGAAPLFAQGVWLTSVEPLTEDELTRATLLADAALILFTVGTLVATRTRLRSLTKPPVAFRRIRPRVIWAISCLAVPIGTFGLIAFAHVPGIRSIGREALGDWSTSSYVVIVQAWAGLSLIALIYHYGFRWWLTVPTLLYLSVMALQGYDRYRVIIPGMLLVQIYLDRRNRAWPGPAMVAVLVGMALAFYPMKSIGRVAQEGGSLAEMASEATSRLEKTFTGSDPDQTFLDQYAAALTLVDDRGRFYLGQPFFALVTLPIPRQLWPAKPAPADYIEDFSTSARPLRAHGMIVTYLGEAYANFWYVGVVFVPFALGFGLTRLFLVAYSHPFNSLVRFAYLMVACNLVQVFRDGLVSLFMFTVVNMLPLSSLVALHLLRRPEPHFAPPSKNVEPRSALPYSSRHQPRG